MHDFINLFRINDNFFIYRKNTSKTLEDIKLQINLFISNISNNNYTFNGCKYIFVDSIGGNKFVCNNIFCNNVFMKDSIIEKIKFERVNKLIIDECVINNYIECEFKKIGLIIIENNIITNYRKMEHASSLNKYGVPHNYIEYLHIKFDNNFLKYYHDNYFRDKTAVEIYEMVSNKIYQKQFCEEENIDYNLISVNKNIFK